MIYTCKRCGKQFDLMGKSDYCPECRNRTTPCVICGKPILQKNPKVEVKTCSRECRGKYRAQSGMGKKAAAKSLITKQARYGDGSGAKFKPKICKLCGKEFIPNSATQIFCKDAHYGPCPVCGKPSLIKDLASGKARTCSEECRVALITKLARERDNTGSISKQRQTCLERYGVDCYAKTDEYKEKTKASNLEKYGVEWYTQTEEYKTRSTETNMKKYGVANPAQNSEIKQKIRTTVTENHGGMGMASEEIRQKIYATNLEVYGDEHPARVLQCKQKSKAIILRKFGFESYAQTKERLANTILDPSKIDDFWEFRNNPEKYVAEHYSTKPYADVLAKDVGVNETSIYGILIDHNCKEIIDRTRTSIIEREVHEFLLTLVDESEIRWCDHRVITPLELDFYLPNYKFAIECNPTYTHNSSFPSFGDAKPKETVYHRNKTNACEAKGIFLLHIFGYDWAYRRDVIKSIIRNVLGKSIKLYARNTIVKIVDAKTASEFLEMNHRQGYANSPIRLGLFDKKTNELVSLMTFGKTRNTIGKQVDDTSDTFELVRFCNILDHSVIGGASKLFKYFIKNYHPEKIVSFSDRAHTRGRLYSLLGFTEDHRSDPGYMWVDILTEEYKSRVACQKHNLPHLFDDITEDDIQNKSERDIMMEHGYGQVYDSGTIKWKYIDN